MKNHYKQIIDITKQANEAWFQDNEISNSISIAFNHLNLILLECQKSLVFKNDVQRRKDFFWLITAIIRCAFHYQILAQNGCFDDARFFIRKAMEFYVIATGVGYDDDLYKKWKNEEFTKRGKGFSYLSKRLLASSPIPNEEKEHIKWMLGQSNVYLGPSQYHFLSNESVHGLSCKVLRSQVNPDGSFKLDIAHIKSEVLREKMNIVVTLLFNSANLALGVFKYLDYVNSTGITPNAEKIRATNDLLLKQLSNQKFLGKHS